MNIPLFITLYAGFIHAFETDHLLAVGNIVTRRTSLKLSLKDGIWWGLGHTSTILAIGLLMLVLKMNIAEHQFRYFEAGVGLMLILLGFFRLKKYLQNRHNEHTHQHHENGQHKHGLAYSVGLVHGLAGSGVLMALVMSEMNSALNGLSYLALFGIGSVAGMALAAGLFSLPFSRKILQYRNLHVALLVLSCLLCIVYGGKVIYDNLLS